MGERIRFPRLTKADVEGLMSAHQKLVALDATLKGTNWAGARACIVLVGDVDLLIAKLFNKAEATMLRAGAAAAAESPQDAPAEITTQSSGDPDELAPPGQPEAPDQVDPSVWDTAIKAAASNTEIADWIKTQTPATLDPATYPDSLRRIIEGGGR